MAKAIRNPDMGVHPIRKRLPRNYSLEIGRIITRWAILEDRMRRGVYLLAGVDQKTGRVAIGTGRASSLVTRIEELMLIEGIATSFDLNKLQTRLAKLESFRDALVHGLWIKHPTTKLPVLQRTSGKYVPLPGGLPAKARIDPISEIITIEYLRHFAKAVDTTTKSIEGFLDKIFALLQKSPG